MTFNLIKLNFFLLQQAINWDAVVIGRIKQPSKNGINDKENTWQKEDNTS